MQLVDREGQRADGLAASTTVSATIVCRAQHAKSYGLSGTQDGQQHHLRRQHGHVLPRPGSEQRQPDVGEHAGPLEAAVPASERAGDAHVRRPRARRRPAAARRRPRSSSTGRRARRKLLQDPSSFCCERIQLGRALGRLGLADAEEFAQQQIFGVHRDVRLELALPPSLGVLEREQVVAGPAKGAPSLIAPAVAIRHGRGERGCVNRGRGCGRGQFLRRRGDGAVHSR